MSFSSEVKEELSLQISGRGHCRTAELTAILTMCGGVSISSEDTLRLRIHTENVYVARKSSMLLREIFHISPEVRVTAGRRKNASGLYTLLVPGHDDALQVLKKTGLIRSYSQITEDMSISGTPILKRDCCKRAYLRGVFLVSGSISDPRKSYHLEIVCPLEERADEIRDLIRYFDLDAKIVKRKSNYIVYMKEGAQIVDFLNVCGAHQSLMELENIRILREISNHVNRKVNCETANLNKTVTAAFRQQEDIRYIQEHIGLENLPESLRETALLRLEEPDLSLKELGALHNPPVGKSGVNHRLKKLSEIAGNHRN